MTDGEITGGGDTPTGGAKRPLTKTPMFTARNSARYERQELIKQIDDAERTHLICYVGGPNTEIDRNDIIGFVDLLHNIPEGQPIDLFLHTFGGDVDACEKLIRLIHASVIDTPFRVVIPDVAKSAGTLMALSANEILMSDTSELGMIDPQFPMRDNQGNEFWHSVIAYLDAHEEYAMAIRSDRNDPVALLRLDNFDAKVVRKFQGIRDRVRTFAEDLLKLRGLPASTIANELMSPSRWKTHGQPISHADAAQLGLPILYIPTNDPRWTRYWKLYCLQRLAIGQNGKIFESSYVSQVIED
jgi:Serine dehydrogenase proteinase